jgi:hypothetical protein
MNGCGDKRGERKKRTGILLTQWEKKKKTGEQVYSFLGFPFQSTTDRKAQKNGRFLPHNS